MDSRFSEEAQQQHTNVFLEHYGAEIGLAPIEPGQAHDENPEEEHGDEDDNEGMDYDETQDLPDEEYDLGEPQLPKLKYAYKLILSLHYQSTKAPATEAETQRCGSWTKSRISSICKAAHVLHSFQYPFLIYPATSGAEAVDSIIFMLQ